MVAESLNLMEKENSYIGYKYNYICTLKIIEKLIFSIKKIDPNSIIVIQSDHGINLRINIESGIFYKGLVKDEATRKNIKN